MKARQRVEFTGAEHIGGAEVVAPVDRSDGEGRMMVGKRDREERRRAAELRCSGEGGSRSAGHGGARERWCGRDGACRRGGAVVIQHAAVVWARWCVLGAACRGRRGPPTQSVWTNGCPTHNISDYRMFDTLRYTIL